MRTASIRVPVASTQALVHSTFFCDDMKVLSGDNKKAQNNGNDRRLCSDSDHLNSDNDHLNNSHHLSSSSVSQCSNDWSSGHLYSSNANSGHCSDRNNGLYAIHGYEGSDNGGQNNVKMSQKHSCEAHSSRKCQSQNLCYSCHCYWLRRY